MDPARTPPAPPAPLRHEIVRGDGSRGVAHEYGADHASAGASLLFLPALGVPISYYRPLLDTWARRGRHIVGLELRGMPLSGRRQLRRNDFGYATLLADLPAAVRQTPLAAARELALAGHSLGGQLSLLAAATGRVRASRVVTIASGSSSPTTVRGCGPRVLRRGQVATVRALTATLGYFPGDRMGFAGRQPRTLMYDWANEARHGVYRLLGDPTDYETALARLTAPALLLALEGDALVSRASVARLAERLPPGTATLRRIPAPAGDPGGFHHIRWARRRASEVLAHVEDWLRAPLPEHRAGER
ncbi:alpha/beta fold hydrolase [Streptomyces sp. 8K308]|uniref:alpha/beta fold hydrolase n=1 Tax=Streptomyces sp. 8K308 TaxID=2530388 RepID=UPI001044B674|nr:alpha/beta fold hydrolase [Streptomyces sp. 8K308]TDC27456.1 alpha/beta fold hydrolase [Streptomyces sp. 8K308]